MSDRMETLEPAPITRRTLGLREVFGCREPAGEDLVLVEAGDVELFRRARLADRGGDVADALRSLAKLMPDKAERLRVLAREIDEMTAAHAMSDGPTHDIPGATPAGRP